jgi:hypothetical protein
VRVIFEASSLISKRCALRHRLMSTRSSRTAKQSRSIAKRACCSRRARCSFRGMHGNLVKNPALQVQRDSAQLIRQFAQEFGLTPSCASTHRQRARPRCDDFDNPFASTSDLLMTADVDKLDAAELRRLKLSPEVAWYLRRSRHALPDCPPRWKTPEPKIKGARFDPKRVDRVLHGVSTSATHKGRVGRASART